MMPPSRNVEIERPGRSDAARPGRAAVRARRSRLVALLASSKVRLLAGAVLLLAVSGAMIVSGGGLHEKSIEDAVSSLEIAGGLIVFPVIYAVLTVLLFPGSVMTAAGGALFGTLAGTVLSVIGATIGACAAFLVGRRLGRREVEQIAGRRVEALDDWLARRGFLAVLYVRLIPIFPFNALNYAAGVTGVRLRDYVLGTLLGIIPGTFAYAALGGSLDDPLSPEFLGAVALVLLLAAGGPFLNRRLQARGEAPDDPGRG